MIWGPVAAGSSSLNVELWMVLHLNQHACSPHVRAATLTVAISGANIQHTATNSSCQAADCQHAHAIMRLTRCVVGHAQEAQREAHVRFQKLQMAYDVLRDPEKRAAYDRGQLFTH